MIARRQADGLGDRTKGQPLVGQDRCDEERAPAGMARPRRRDPASVASGGVRGIEAKRTEVVEGAEAGGLITAGVGQRAIPRTEGASPDRDAPLSGCDSAVPAFI